MSRFVVLRYQLRLERLATSATITLSRLLRNPTQSVLFLLTGRVNKFVVATRASKLFVLEPMHPKHLQLLLVCEICLLSNLRKNPACLPLGNREFAPKKEISSSRRMMNTPNYTPLWDSLQQAENIVRTSFSCVSSFQRSLHKALFPYHLGWEFRP